MQEGKRQESKKARSKKTRRQAAMCHGSRYEGLEPGTRQGMKGDSDLNTGTSSKDKIAGWGVQEDARESSHKDGR